VTVRSGNDTKIKAGVLHVTASGSTRVDVVDRADSKSVIGGYGATMYGLPIGEVGVQIAPTLDIDGEDLGPDLDNPHPQETLVKGAPFNQSLARVYRYV